MANEKGATLHRAMFALFALCVGLYLLLLYVQAQARKVVPSLTAEISGAKSLCEGHGQVVKEIAGRGRIRRAKLDYGERLYVDAKAEYDACVTFLCGAIDSGFANYDAETAKGMLARARFKRDAFVTWARAVREMPRQYGEVSPADVLELLKWLTELDNARKAQLKAELERCRFRPWEQL